MQRAYDQILEDVCLQNLPVVFAIDRAGVVGADGETHHGTFDISYLSSMPNMTVLAPADYGELENMLEYALTLDGPCAIRYPRGDEEENISEKYGSEIEYGKSVTLSTGKDVQIIAVGTFVPAALTAADILNKKGIKAGVTNARFLKPIDEESISDISKKTKLTATLEDNVLSGGFGSYVNGLDLNSKVINFGWPDEFIKHGKTEELKDIYGLTPEKIAERIAVKLNEK